MEQLELSHTVRQYPYDLPPAVVGAHGPKRHNTQTRTFQAALLIIATGQEEQPGPACVPKVPDPLS